MTLYKQVEGGQKRRLSNFWATNAHLVGHVENEEVRRPVQLISSFGTLDEVLIVYYPEVKTQDYFRGEEVNNFVRKLGFEKVVAKPLFSRLEREVTFSWEPTLPPAARK